MHYATQLKNEIQEQNDKNKEVIQRITTFMAYLLSSKFTGESGGESKDWISTGEVLRELQEIRSELQR